MFKSLDVMKVVRMVPSSLILLRNSPGLHVICCHETVRRDVSVHFYFN